jgi:hypothetical protein
MVGYMRITMNGAFPKSRPVPIGDGLAVLSPVIVTVRADPGEEPPYDVDLTVTVTAGQAVITSVTATSRPGEPGISSTGLRQLPLARLLFLAYEGSVMRATEAGGVYEMTPVEPADNLEAAAAAYRLAAAVGVPPVQAVAARFGITPSTARGRVERARAKGLLSETIKGKAKP